MCVDFQNLNRVSLKERHLLPSIEHVLQLIFDLEWFSLLDGFSGYNQILVKEEDRYKTTFTTKWRTMAYQKMPFGMPNVGATFQKVMDKAFLNLM